jgi:hypothetical protein
MTIAFAMFFAALDLGTLPFSIDAACAPFHHSLGVPAFSMDAGRAWAIPCERLGSDTDEASAAFQVAMIEDPSLNSLVLRGIGTYKFESEDGTPAPAKFWLVHLNSGPRRKTPFAIDDRGILYVVWYNGMCELEMDWSHESTIVKCR